VVNQIFSQQGGHDPAFNGQWSNNRYAFLFKPGTHQVTVNVGFYTVVYGLGNSPTDTTLASFRCENGDFDYEGGALSNFWRGVENVATKNNTLWAVSQASPLRRVYITGNLDLYQYNSGCCAGWASGGYLADSTVSGTITSGSQQQWFTRNSNIGKWAGGVWNMVFVGNSGDQPASHCGGSGGSPYTSITNTPVIAEKPYVTIDSAGKFYLRIPKVETNKRGPTADFNNVDQVDFANVYVGTDADSAATINAKLAAGLHVVLSPGNYNLEDSLSITKANQVLLGLGLATLIAANGKPAVVVGNVDGVRIGGFLFQAGQKNTSALIQWGASGYAGSASNPGFFYDAFARVGGTNNPSEFQVYADTMAEINSGNVVLDNTWFWRADHGVSGEVSNSDNPNNHGLVVNGANVVAYALASEHQLQDLVQWNGENGRTYFYQSELPYDVTEDNFGTPGYTGYRVASNVQNHAAYGAGVYSFFRDHAVTTANGFISGTGSNVTFTNPLTVFLNGLGQITHVWNGKGSTVSTPAATAYVC
jgi:hypothetical protein